MYRLNWLFCNGSHWFQVFETEEDAVNYANHCDLLQAHSVEKVWVASSGADKWLRQKN